MTGPAPVDLIHLADPAGNRCIVRVTGRSQPGVLTGHDILRADIFASASFVDARLDLYLFQHDLDSWEEALSHPGPDRTAGIGGDRGLSLDIHVHEDGAGCRFRSATRTALRRSWGPGPRETGSPITAGALNRSG